MGEGAQNCRKLRDVIHGQPPSAICCQPDNREKQGQYLDDLIFKSHFTLLKIFHFQVHSLLHPVQEPRQLSCHGGTSASISQEKTRNPQVPKIDFTLSQRCPTKGQFHQHAYVQIPKAQKDSHASISPTFYEQLLRWQIPKAQKSCLT